MASVEAPAPSGATTLPLPARPPQRAATAVSPSLKPGRVDSYQSPDVVEKYMFSRYRRSHSKVREDRRLLSINNKYLVGKLDFVESHPSTYHVGERDKVLQVHERYKKNHAQYRKVNEKHMEFKIVEENDSMHSRLVNTHRGLTPNQMGADYTPKAITKNVERRKTFQNNKRAAKRNKFQELNAKRALENLVMAERLHKIKNDDHPHKADKRKNLLWTVDPSSSHAETQAEWTRANRSLKNIRAMKSNRPLIKGGGGPGAVEHPKTVEKLITVEENAAKALEKDAVQAVERATLIKSGIFDKDVHEGRQAQLAGGRLSTVWSSTYVGGNIYKERHKRIMEIKMERKDSSVFPQDAHNDGDNGLLVHGRRGAPGVGFVYLAAGAVNGTSKTERSKDLKSMLTSRYEVDKNRAARAKALERKLAPKSWVEDHDRRADLVKEKRKAELAAAEAKNFGPARGLVKVACKDLKHFEGEEAPTEVMVAIFRQEGKESDAPFDKNLGVTDNFARAPDVANGFEEGIWLSCEESSSAQKADEKEGSEETSSWDGDVKLDFRVFSLPADAAEINFDHELGHAFTSMAALRKKSKVGLTLTRNIEEREEAVGQLILTSAWLQVDQDGFVEGMKKQEMHELAELEKRQRRDLVILKYEKTDWLHQRSQSVSKVEQKRRDILRREHDRKHEKLKKVHAEEISSFSKHLSRTRPQRVKHKINKMLSKLMPSSRNSVVGYRSSMRGSVGARMSTRMSLMAYSPKKVASPSPRATSPKLRRPSTAKPSSRKKEGMTEWGNPDKRLLTPMEEAKRKREYARQHPATFSKHTIGAVFRTSASTSQIQKLKKKRRQRVLLARSSSARSPHPSTTEKPAAE